ncbi:hypothetical protein QYE76_021500 [Lolium multiflorum]|uniref:Aminotransferase-like plant mobile domain-containing protein n=1 Tax=Lolium multiflorum TaxID=4521 RepID=A0AAD8R6N0_LOLMU|nr:hypothetical protein QYE76_021500 [Lolium multiflorum]
MCGAPPIGATHALTIAQNILMVWLLDEEYDREHRAVHMTERGTDLHPLKIRYHGTVDIPYDERYTEFIQPTGLMPFISLVSRGGPNMNAAALTALVDRWRPETHTFHLRAGEMAPTLEDLIGRAPPAPANPKERVPAAASFSWIKTNFAQCPEGANEDTRRTYARVYLWYMISKTLFPDSGGKLAHWCWLKALTVLDNRWSWGTAALAYLYRQLDEACRKTGSRTGSGGIGGCLLLLSVEWEPYGSYYRIGAGMADLNHKCTEEALFWRMRCPLICMWLVEHHQPHRVMRRFLYQECPPGQDTDKALHRLDRQRQRKITNWPVHHSGHIATFQHCLEATRTTGPLEIVPHDLAAFNNYLQWFHENTCIELVKRAYADYILDDPIEFDEVAQSQHDTYARRGRSTSIASELNFVRSEIQKTADECEIIWEQSEREEKPVGPLRHFIKNTARKMRWLANLLGCREGEIPTSSSSEEPRIPPEDDLIMSQSIPPKHTSKQAPRSAYQLKPKGNAPKRYTPEDYVTRGKKVVIEEDEGPVRRSSLSRMRHDEPFSSEEEEHEEQEEQQEQQQQGPRQRTKRMAVRKQPVRTTRRGRH